VPRTPRFFLAVTLALAACSPATATPPATPTPIPTANATPSTTGDLSPTLDPFFSDLTKPRTPGCAVAVYRAGEIAFAKGYGLANLEHDTPITPSTNFDVGSISKQFTAMAILLLAEDGKLSLDDDVRKYIPELPAYAQKPITLRHLLHHTSGLRDYAGFLTLGGINEADVPNDDDALFAIAHQKALDFPTGTEWRYSNAGYFLLSIVVRRTSGKTLATFAKERIFGPLGMTSTFILDNHARTVPERATGYAPRHEGATGFWIEMSNFEQTGNGGVQTNVLDLAKWDANFYEPKVGTKATLDLLRTPGKLDDGKPLTYAMGLDIQNVNGILSEEHLGEWAGYRADLLRFPTERLTVACLCNVADAAPEDRAIKVAIALDPKLAPPATTSSRGTERQLHVTDKPRWSTCSHRRTRRASSLG
jgi:CubicO group peptidase (beta-lactamase class C family)